MQIDRRSFIFQSALLGVSCAIPRWTFACLPDFPIVRIPISKRKFSSSSIEKTIDVFKKQVADKELCWLFENCFPNTLDTTVSLNLNKERPDTYVITGDIDAMWMRDSAAQVWPYLQFVKEDKDLQNLIAGVINRQTSYILKDPFANAFYQDEQKIGEWGKDLTQMKPGVHERKWEIDSLCYPIRLAYNYWKTTHDTTPFDGKWIEAIKLILSTFKDQQRKLGNGSYKFQRRTAVATDTLPMSGYGMPVNPIGLICSAFRPSDDATTFSFLIPSNYFAVVSLNQAAEMIEALHADTGLQKELISLASEVKIALEKYGKVNHPVFGEIIPFEIDGFGSVYLMDDSNVPSLLSLPYLGAMEASNSLYINTRKFILSDYNPFYFSGLAAKGVGGPHVGRDMIWPMSVIIQALTSSEDQEIRSCLKILKSTHAGTGFMHESFHKDNPKNFTRAWFAWANTLFGELLWKTFKEQPHLLQNL